MQVTRNKTRRTLVVAFIAIALGALGFASSRPGQLPTMPYHPWQGIYLQNPTPIAPISQPLLP